MLIKLLVVVVMFAVFALIGYSKWSRYTPTGNEEKETEDRAEN